MNDLPLKQVVAKFFCYHLISIYTTGIERLVDQYENCLSSDGDYVEKYIISHCVCGFIFTGIAAHGSALCDRDPYFWNDSRISVVYFLEALTPFSKVQTNGLFFWMKCKLQTGNPRYPYVILLFIIL